MSRHFDYLVLGSGMAGLAVASLLARAGKRVGVLEAHEHPGGCAHSFPLGRYTFCAAVHYIFSCGEGEPVSNWLKKIGLDREVTFERLDPEGYDRLSCPAAGLRFNIPNGLEKWADRLVDRFPAHRAGVLRFFAVIRRIMDEARRMPFELTPRQLLAVPVRFPTVFRYRNWTLQHLFDRLALPPEVRAVLATQVGDVGLPPARVSLVIYAALVWSYGGGAYYPTRHFKHFIDSVAGVVENAAGCGIEYRTEVTAIDIRHGRAAAVRTGDGREFTADTVISNIDPRRTVELAGPEHFPGWFRRKAAYDYSVSSFTVYLGVRGLDLRQHGFGNWNVWHYPSLDFDRVYDAQAAGDLSDPWLFLSTPTLHSAHPAADICPEGEQILELVTTCGYGPYRELHERGRAAYLKHKKAVADRMLDVVERHYVPDLRRHLAKKVAGSPTTNVRYLWAPGGNIYGSELSPANVHFARLKYRTPVPNLFLTGASAEFPSVGGTVAGGCRLYTHLTGDPVNPGRDPFGLV
jgi:phytoene dehydrogenase-like protein